VTEPSDAAYADTENDSPEESEILVAPFSAFVFAGLFSFGWSEQSGVSLSVEKAEARIGRPLTPMSVAGVARRQNRRAGYGYGYGAAAAVGTAAAIGATAPYYTGAGYPAGSLL
jgi:hypothetical protein